MSDEVAADDVLSIPDVSGMDTLTAALTYAEAGLYVHPVARGTKNPGQVLGKAWQTKSSTDPEQIVAWFAGTDHCLGINPAMSRAMAFDVDRPELVPAVLADAIADLSPPQAYTRPDTPGRVHALFMMPPGRTLGDGTSKLGAAWGEIRTHNIVVYPSEHSEGGEYGWAVTGAVPVLPDSIGCLLGDAGEPGDSVTTEEAAKWLALCTEELVPGVLDQWVGMWDRKMAAKHSRHGALVSIGAGAMKDAGAGIIAGPRAFDALHKCFVAAMSTAMPDEKGKARRKLSAKTAGDEFVSVLNWAVARGMEVKRKEHLEARQDLFSTALGIEAIVLPATTDRIDPQTGEITTVDTVTEEIVQVENLCIDEDASPAGNWPTGLSDAWWNTRKTLAHIRQAAQSAITCPEAVLIASWVEVVGHTMPNLVLPNVQNAGQGGTSLNCLGSIVAPPGVGKDEALKVARSLFDITSTANPMVVVAPPVRKALGSGEGIASRYVRTKAPRQDDGDVAGLKDKQKAIGARLKGARATLSVAKTKLSKATATAKARAKETEDAGALEKLAKAIDAAQKEVDAAQNAVDINLGQVATGSTQIASLMDSGANVGPPVPTQIAWKFIFGLSESDTLAALAGRQGNTLMPEIRKAAMGQDLGFGNRDEDNTHEVAAGTYRWAGIILGQPGKLGWLFDDAQGGTPQRFLHACAVDVACPEEPPLWPGKLTVDLPTVAIKPVGGAVQTDQAPPGLGGLPWVVMDLCPAASTWVRATRRKALRGDQLDENAHSGLARLRFAAFLALLEGRVGISCEDWELAGDFVEYSNRVRSWIGRVLQERDDRNNAVAAVRRGNARVIENATVISAEQQAKAVSDRALAVIKANPGGVSNSALSESFGVEKRALLPGVLAAHEAAGSIRSETGRKAGSVKWLAV